jgi:hypothetical protein
MDFRVAARTATDRPQSAVYGGDVDVRTSTTCHFAVTFTRRHRVARRRLHRGSKLIL